jgi:hypothetical protein
MGFTGASLRDPCGAKQIRGSLREGAPFGTRGEQNFDNFF